MPHTRLSTSVRKNIAVILNGTKCSEESPPERTPFWGIKRRRISCHEKRRIRDSSHAFGMTLGQNRRLLTLGLPASVRNDKGLLFSKNTVIPTTAKEEVLSHTTHVILNEVKNLKGKTSLLPVVPHIHSEWQAPFGFAYRGIPRIRSEWQTKGVRREPEQSVSNKIIPHIRFLR